MSIPSAPPEDYVGVNGSMEPLKTFASWLSEATTQEHWRPYRGSSVVEQCSHPDRATKVMPLIKAAGVETRGKAAFLIRCHGPCNERLGPTDFETFPGDLLILNNGKRLPSTADGKPLIMGRWLSFNQAVNIAVASGEVLYLLAIFKKR
ncbi:hypothetical protein CBS147352_10780 [Aspergillus niger]|nr:hypothetical protein CBS147324_10253 [Aspergillus niger]KAI3038198.1 hypothetical protein CBS147352_10780 [Aspergillus niger]